MHLLFMRKSTHACDLKKSLFPLSEEGHWLVIKSDKVIKISHKWLKDHS